MGFTLNTLCIDHFPLNTFLSSLFILLRRSLYLYDWVIKLVINYQYFASTSKQRTEMYKLTNVRKNHKRANKNVKQKNQISKLGHEWSEGQKTVHYYYVKVVVGYTADSHWASFFSSVLEFISHFRICSILHTKPQYVQKTLDATKGLDHHTFFLMICQITLILSVKQIF